MSGKFGRYISSFNRYFLRSYAMNNQEGGAGVNVSSMRKPYRKQEDAFDIDAYHNKSPLNIFSEWFSEACKDAGIIEPNAVALATSTLDGKPSMRMVLLKSFGEDGFKFFTNYKSRKGQELELNPRGYMLFYWPTLHRQVRIEGDVEKVSEEESETYFSSRPRQSQISCYASDQSQPTSKSELEQRRIEAEALFKDKLVEKPKYWGGYLLKPQSYEFWQGRTDRFHDRIQFRRLCPEEKVDEAVTKPVGNGWYYERLCP